jgi:excisionase family DNA binding protein
MLNSPRQLSLADLDTPEVEALDIAPDRPAVAGLLTATEVAKVLRVPRSTVYELARNRRIPFLKVGRRTLFEMQSLQDWIATQTVEPR